MVILTGLAIFIVILLFIEGSFLVFRRMRNPEKKRVQMRLKALSSATGYENQSIDIVRKSFLSEVPWLNWVLLSFRWTDRMHLLLDQAGIQRPLGFFILLSLLLAFGGFLIGSRVFTTISSQYFWQSFLVYRHFSIFFQKRIEGCKSSRDNYPTLWI
jgi:tight adherence protein B